MGIKEKWSGEREKALKYTYTDTDTHDIDTTLKIIC